MAERVKLVAKGNGGKNRMGREKSLSPLATPLVTLQRLAYQ